MSAYAPQVGDTVYMGLGESVWTVVAIDGPMAVVQTGKARPIRHGVDRFGATMGVPAHSLRPNRR